MPDFNVTFEEGQPEHDRRPTGLQRRQTQGIGHGDRWRRGQTRRLCLARKKLEQRRTTCGTKATERLGSLRHARQPMGMVFGLV